MILKPCCALRFWLWRRRIVRGRSSDRPYFTCDYCGNAYRRTEGGSWQQWDALASLKDMVEHDPRGHLTEDQ